MMDHDTWVAYLQKFQGEKRAELHELTADRPAHAAYLAKLLTLQDPLTEDDPLPPGVSTPVAWALQDDAAWITRDLSDLPHGADTGPYPRAYAELRRRNRAAAQARARTAELNRDPLVILSRLLTPKDPR